MPGVGRFQGQDAETQETGRQRLGMRVKGSERSHDPRKQWGDLAGFRNGERPLKRTSGRASSNPRLPPMKARGFPSRN